MKQITLITLSFYFFLPFISAQKFNKLKFGKIDPADLELTDCPFEPGAEAMVLDETCEIFFTRHDRIQLFMQVHRRLKIFTQAGLSRGEFNLPYRIRAEGIIGLEVQVIHPDGKVDKLSKDNIFTEKINKYFNQIKITCPNLQPGSIIEYQYKLKTDDYFSSPDWYFQKDIPTRNSQVLFKAHPGLQFTPLLQLPKYIQNKDGVYIAENLVSLKPEPYNDRPNDFKCKIKFQISGYQRSNGAFEPYMADWKAIYQYFDKSLDFKNGFFNPKSSKKTWEAIKNEVSALPDDISKANYIFQYVTDNVKWNGRFTLFPEGNIDKIFDSKSAGSAAINAAISNLLRNSGFTSYAIISNPVSEGGINSYFPDLDNFGHVFGMVILNDERHFFDGIYPEMTFGQLGEEDMLDQAFLLGENIYTWIELPQQKYEKVVSIRASIHDDGSMLCDVSARMGKLAYTVEKEKYSKDEIGRYWLPRMLADPSPLSIQDFIITSDDYVSKNIKCKFKVKGTDLVVIADDLMYIPINLYSSFKENPFKDGKRILPIDFKTFLMENYVFSFKIPDGFIIEGLPESINMTTSDKSLTLLMTFTHNADNSIVINRKLNINNTLISQILYDEVKLLFDELINRSNDMVVLRKETK